MEVDGSHFENLTILNDDVPASLRETPAAFIAARRQKENNSILYKNKLTISGIRLGGVALEKKQKTGSQSRFNIMKENIAAINYRRRGANMKNGRHGYRIKFIIPELREQTGRNVNSAGQPFRKNPAN